MGIDTEKFIRKPLYVDAVRINATNFDEVAQWCQGEVTTDEVPGQGTTKKFIKVRVHNPKNPRQTKAFVGDWLLYTERGYKVYTNKAFRAAFDSVTPEQAPLSDSRLTGDPVADAQAEERTHIPGVPLAEEVEFVPATPQGIADAVNEHQPLDPHEASAEEEIIAPGVVGTPDSGVTTAFIPPEPIIDQDQARVAEGLPPGEVDPPEPVVVVPPAVLEDAVPVVPVAPGVAVSNSPTAPPIHPPQPPVDDNLTVEDVAAQETIVPAAAEGKRVLSMKEQREMTGDEVQELIRTGEAVLAQDLAV